MWFFQQTDRYSPVAANSNIPDIPSCHGLRPMLSYISQYCCCHLTSGGEHDMSYFYLIFWHVYVLPLVQFKNSAHCNTWRHRCVDCCVLLCVSRDIDISRNLRTCYLYTCMDAECGKGKGGEIRKNKTSIALTFHITRMADTNIERNREQNTRDNTDWNVGWKCNRKHPQLQNPK